MWAGFSAKPASQHIDHHSEQQSILVQFTVGNIVSKSHPDLPVLQLCRSESHVDQTERRVRGLVAAGLSTVDVPLSWLIGNVGKLAVQCAPKDASDGLLVHVTMLPREINGRRYSLRVPRLVETFYRGAESLSVASFKDCDGKLFQSVVSALRYPARVRSHLAKQAIGWACCRYIGQRKSVHYNARAACPSFCAIGGGDQALLDVEVRRCCKTGDSRAPHESWGLHTLTAFPRGDKHPRRCRYREQRYRCSIARIR